MDSTEYIGNMRKWAAEIDVPVIDYMVSFPHPCKYGMYCVFAHPYTGDLIAKLFATSDTLPVIQAAYDDTLKLGQTDKAVIFDMRKAGYKATVIWEHPGKWVMASVKGQRCASVQDWADQMGTIVDEAYHEAKIFRAREREKERIKNINKKRR